MRKSGGGKKKRKRKENPDGHPGKKKEFPSKLRNDCNCEGKELFISHVGIITELTRHCGVTDSQTPLLSQWKSDALGSLGKLDFALNKMAFAIIGPRCRGRLCCITRHFQNGVVQKVCVENVHAKRPSILAIISTRSNHFGINPKRGPST